jgi:hypothetical protein
MIATNSIVPDGTEQSWDSSLRRFRAVKHDKFPPVVAGFDGFVDTILHAVSERRSVYTKLAGVLYSFRQV